MPDVTELFTTSEAATLAEAPARAVEKAIEEGIVEVRREAPPQATRHRRLLSAEGVYYVAFLGRCDLRFSKAHKEKLWECFKRTPADRLLAAEWHLSPGIDIRPGELLGPTCQRVASYSRARDRWIEVNPDIMGGTPVIRGTRMTVYAVAGRIDHGERIDDILAENPDLPADAIDAAVLYAHANPLVGRPGARPWHH